MKENNIIMSKLTNEELTQIQGGTIWSCDEPMPSYVSYRPNSCVYYAWLWAHCKPAPYCPPTTWNYCY